MHPPFFVVDHKVGPRAPQPGADRPVTRRSTPEPLALGLPDPHGIADRLADNVTEGHDTPAPSPPGGKGHWLSRFWRLPTRTAVRT